MDKMHGNEAENLVKAAGCGPFQFVLSILTSLIPKIGTAYAALFMAFGIYNPGWRCLDENSFNSSSNSTNISATTNLIANNKTPTAYRLNTSNGIDRHKTTDIFYVDSCEIFEACQNVEFDSSVSTVVTEWGLICKKAWVPSFIISIQMLGVIVGSLVCGQVGDTFGRKRTLDVSYALMGILSIIAAFSTYWQILAVLQFFIGCFVAFFTTASVVYPAEFLNSKWRAREAAVPGRSIGCAIFGIMALLCKDWKVILLSSGIVYILFFIPSMAWVPESLRFLQVKSKRKEFEKVAKKIIKMNKLQIPTTGHRENVKLSPEVTNSEFPEKGKVRVYSMLDLFRRGYRIYSILVAFIWVLPGAVNYAVSYGVQAIPGNFYINLIIVTSVEIPFSILPMFIPNIIGRKRASIVFMTVSFVALLAAIGFGLWATQSIKSVAMAMTIAAVRIGCQFAFTTNTVLCSELYPTVVRSIALGYCGLMVRIGGMIAPLLIPRDSQQVNVCYGIMAAGVLLCCLALMKLPETKGKVMRGEFDED